MSRATVSVVLPTYQRRDTVLDAVTSVLEQRQPADEVIVVDDGSTDGTADALEAAFGPRIRVLRQRNRGPSAARNAGIRAAHGDLIAFQDSDNVWLPHHLEVVHEVVARYPEAVLVGTGRDYRFGDESAADADLADVAAALLLDDLSVGYLSAVAARRDALVRAGGFDETLRYAEDIDVFLRLALQGPFALLSGTSVRRRTSSDSLEAAGRAGGAYAGFVARSADSALAALHANSGSTTLLRAARAREAMGAALLALEAGAGANELRPHLDDLSRWLPKGSDLERSITRQIEAAHVGRHAPALRARMLATVAEVLSAPAPTARSLFDRAGNEWTLALGPHDRLEPTDARALEEFVATDAIVGCTYGVKVFDAQPDGTIDMDFEWVELLSIPAAPTVASIRTTFRVVRGAASEELPPRAPGTPALHVPPAPPDSCRSISACP